MTLERINPEELGRPSGFAHAVRATDTARVYLAGQTALDKAGAIVGSTIVEQFEQALSNLLTALAAAGGAAEHLATVTIYIVDIADYRANAREIGAVWRRLAGTEYPAMAGIGIARLWDEDALIELQGVAEIPR
ncbi:MAG TPA: RidA family protein [Jatrophihabitans sp.]|jgi:enamine deaminase RidA (YjgF/YER057c/UK114 family)|uniref:RidA family protein n=1 Tax=Jatrophihabitans sp. TaxID=1932789 RepID=UPI002EE028D4